MTYFAYLITENIFRIKKFKSEEEAIRLMGVFLDATEIDPDSVVVLFSENEVSKEVITEAQKHLRTMRLTQEVLNDLVRQPSEIDFCLNI
jgi:hypothetical protein